MKVKVRISLKEKTYHINLSSIKNWSNKYRLKRSFLNPKLLFIIPFIILVFIYEPVISNVIYNDNKHYQTYENQNPNKLSIEEMLYKNNINIKGVSTSNINYIRSDVGYTDLRVITLEEFFNSYKSPLAEYSDDFIEACERYSVNNWQLLPAIAIAETNGCQTGISFEQKNCWGWGGAGNNRWEFNSFEEAIDQITSRMIRTYGNNRMNAKDIQSTYCGMWCMVYGWKWAKGINYYVYRVNDIGQKYGLERTNEITTFD